MRAFVETVVPGAAILACCLVAPLVIGSLGAIGGGPLLCVGLAVAVALLFRSAADCCR